MVGQQLPDHPSANGRVRAVHQAEDSLCAVGGDVLAEEVALAPLRPPQGQVNHVLPRLAFLAIIGTWKYLL